MAASNSCGLSPASRKALYLAGCKDIMLVVGQQSERLALSSSWNLVTLNRSVPRIFKSQRKICPACQGIGKGERARRLEWEPNWQSHTAPPDYGKAARRPTPTSTGCPAISAPICSGLRWPLTTPLFKGCGDQPVSCY